MELGKRIIDRQEARFRFSAVPSDYWDTIIEHQKYVISWDNFDALLVETEDFAQLSLIFKADDVVLELAKDRKEIQVELFDFLVNLEGMSLESYQKLIGKDLGNLSVCPTAIGEKKKLHLIRSGMIALDEEGWKWLQGMPALRVALIEEQFTTFEEIEGWSLEEELPGLIKSKIPLDAKRKLLLNAEIIECGEDEVLRAEVANVLISSDTVIGDFDEAFIEDIISNAKAEAAIKLLTRMIPRWEESRIMRILKAVGSPYEKIADYGKMPKIPENDINLALAVALQETKMISQFKNEDRSLRIITKRNDPSD